MPMTEKDLKSALKSGDLSPVYFLYGEEPYLVAHFASLTADTAVPADGMEDFNRHVFDGTALSLDALEAAVEAMPLMGEHTCVWVRDYDAGAANAAVTERMKAIIAKATAYSRISQAQEAIRQGEAQSIETENGRVCAVTTMTGLRIPCRAAIVASGVYLKSRIIIGEAMWDGGPQGLQNATGLSGSLTESCSHVLRRGSLLIGVSVPLSQIPVDPGSGQKHPQDTYGKHPKEQQDHQPIHIMFAFGSSHAYFSTTVISGMILEPNTS